MTNSLGLPLESAAVEFAPSVLADRRSQALAIVQKMAAKKWWSTKSKRFVDTIDKMTLAAKQYNELDASVERCRDYLLQQLSTGILRATGIRTMPTTEFSPSLIPPFFFDNASVDWKRDIIDNAGHRFELVRVLIGTSTVSTKMGRPSSTASIDTILREMEKEGYDLGRAQKRIAEEVRVRAKSVGLNVSVGFSDSVVKSRIVRARSDKRPA